VVLTTALLLTAPGEAVAERARVAETCEQLLTRLAPTPGDTATTTATTTSTAKPTGTAGAAYQTACRLKQVGVEGEPLRAVVAKAAEADPTTRPPSDLLAHEERGLVALGDKVAAGAAAVGRIAGVAVGLIIGLWALGLFLARGVFGRSRTLRNIVGANPLVIVEPLDDSEQEQLPSLFQSVLDNLGNDVGGRNIQFVSPQGGEATEVSLADAPSEVKYLSWLLGLLRPLAPKDRITVRLAPQPVGRQGLGMSATLIGPRGSAIKAITLWEAEIELGDIASASPPLSEKERYQLLAGPVATWVYFALADLQQKDVHLFGARRWRSYGLFYVGSRLYKTHRTLAQRLLRAAIDDDPGNIAAHLNVLFAEFDYRRTTKGMEYFVKLKAEVEALPASTLAPRLSMAEPAWREAGAQQRVQPYWYEATWYRTMYGLAAVCVHVASASRNENGAGALSDDCEKVRAKGEKLARDLVGACWVALTDLEGTDGTRPKALRFRTVRQRAQFRQKLELAALLNQMLPSAVLLLVNLRLLTGPPARELEVGGDSRIIGAKAAKHWRRRDVVLASLSPLRAPKAIPELRTLLQAIDPVEFLPARARYNVACVHSEVAQYQNRKWVSAHRSRVKAMEELEKGLTPASAQWARADPALHEVRTHPETRPTFARLLAAALPVETEWHILRDLPFLEVIDAARLWLVGIESGADLIEKVGTTGAPADMTERVEEDRTAWLDQSTLREWAGRARLRRHFDTLLDDLTAVDRVETLLHRLGIASPEELADQAPWLLSRKLRETAPPDWDLGHLIGPWATTVWCRAPV